MFPYFVSLNVVPAIGESTIWQAAKLNAAAVIPASVKATFICFMNPPCDGYSAELVRENLRIHPARYFYYVREYI
jgi:hypothetical protein